MSQEQETRRVKQAQARSCFVCGVENDFGLHMQFYDVCSRDGQLLRVEVDYTVAAHYQGYPGIVHGGILASMLDEVTSRTVLRGDPPRLVVTAKLNMRYRKPVPVETPLHLVGRVVEDRGRVVTVAGEVYGPDGTVLADAEAMLVEVEPSFFGEAMPDELLDWRVYPDEGTGSPRE